MKFLTTILVFLNINIACAQNIVPNPSFEEDTSCPDAFSQIYFCNSWATGSEGTPDYYNACDTNSIFSTLFAVPGNGLGYQPAYAGAAYAGIYGINQLSGLDFHEYLMAQIPPLDSGAAYHVSMEVSVADSSGYESDGLGMLFNTFGSYPTTSTIPIAPQMDFTTSGVITNTTGWTRLSGTFIADSAYTYLVIGVFKDSGNIFKVPVKSPPLFKPFTYYYIDSIIVEKITKAGIPVPRYPMRVRVFPNPLFTDFALLTFDNSMGLFYRLTLYNLQGQIVREWPEITTGKVSIDRKGLVDGFYYYRLQNETGIVAVGTLTVGG